MQKLDMITKNIINDNVKKIGEIFPSVIVEIESGFSIDYDLLRQELSNILIDGSKEKYQLNWPGKKESIINANTPTNNTLRPIKEGSEDFDKTKNLYIEGDNLEVLKLLQESYLNSISVIYIDPPYNTGRNLIYKNSFYRDAEEEILDSGQVDMFGNRLVTNLETNGRFHSDWLSMMYSRIKLGRNLLTNDGVIFLAIDDNEVDNLKKICSEIFGEDNYVGTIVTRCNPQGRGKNNIDPVHEYHLVYARNISEMKPLQLKRKDNNFTNFIRGGNNSNKEERPKRYYPMLVKNNVVSCITQEEYNLIHSNESGFDEKFINDLISKYEKGGYLVVFPLNSKGEKKVWQRTYERAVQECQSYIYENGQIKTPPLEGKTPMSLWIEKEHSNVAHGTNELNSLFGNYKVFDYSKSIYTVRDLISLGQPGKVLDFFSGSATTAHATMLLNSEDDKKRQFIMVQLPEEAAEDSETLKMGFENICEVGKERIRRAGKKIKEETGADIDYGFRVYKLDSSNMKDVYYNPNNLSQEQLNLFESNIKEDRTSDDLLTQVLIDLGLELSLKIEEKTISNNKVYFVEDNSLVACFDEKISMDVIDEIAKYNPLKLVFRDSSFDDNSKINVSERMKRLSPETTIKII